MDPAWLDEVSRRRSKEILADDPQQQAIARQITDALRTLGDRAPRFARMVAARIENGFAQAVPEWSDPVDPLSLRYRIEVEMGAGDPVVLVAAPWTAWGVTLDQVRAEYDANDRGA